MNARELAAAFWIRHARARFRAERRAGADHGLPFRRWARHTLNPIACAGKLARIAAKAAIPLALLLLALSAAGCEMLVLSDQTLCRDMCRPRAVRSFVAGAGQCKPTECVCEAAQPDGGGR